MHTYIHTYIHTYVRTCVHNAYIHRLYKFFVKCRHLSLDCRSWRINTLGFAVCTNTLGVSSHHDEEEEDDDDILIFFAHKILTIAIDLCCRSSSNNQSDDSSRFAERRGIFLQKKVCKRSRSRGCHSVEAFFLAWWCYAVFFAWWCFSFPYFFPEKFDKPSVFVKLSFFSHFFLFLKTEVTETNRRCFLQRAGQRPLTKHHVIFQWPTQDFGIGQLQILSCFFGATGGLLDVF